MIPDSELWANADRSGQREYRTDCPHCSKRKGDKTLSLNTEKRVGKCHRCEWIVGGEVPQHFVERHIDDLERERKKRVFRYNQITDTLRPISGDDLAAQYLAFRLGCTLPKLPRLAFSTGVRYYSGLNRYVTTPAMIAALQDARGRCTGLHITHLSGDGRKAFGSDSRRYCKLHGMAGSAVRLYPATDTLIVAEGIETALALHLVNHDPVWACTSASMLKAFEPPPCVRTLIIAADNDANRTGQRAAWSLYHRLKRDYQCAVMIPDKDNCDWLDMMRSGQ